MEMKFGSRAEIGGTGVVPGEAPAGNEGGAMTLASLPPTKRNDRMVCGTPSSVMVKSEALRLVVQGLVLVPHHHVQNDFLNVTADDDAGASRCRRLLGLRDHSQQHESKHCEAVTEQPHPYPQRWYAGILSGSCPSQTGGQPARILPVSSGLGPRPSFVKADYRPTTITVKLPGIMAGRGWGLVGVAGGGGPKFAVTR